MNYKKSIIILMSGSAAAQAIPILLSPVLSRLYTPREFGLLALYLGLSAVFSVFASGRYDLALIEPAKDDDARGLMFAGLFLSTAFCIALSGIFLIVASPLAQIMGISDSKTSLHLVPVAVFSMSCLSIFTYWMNRRKNFKGMNASRITSSIGIAGLSIGFAFTELKSIGLLLGYISGQLIAVSYQWFAYVREEMQQSRTDMWTMMRQYVRYPKFLIPSTLAGTISAESPVMLLTRFFDTAVAGLFSFANRVTVSPMSIVGNSIGEVYRIRATETFQRYGECRQLFLSHIAVLAAVATLPWAILFFFGPDLFAYVFGEQWRKAGEMAAVLSFVVAFQLVSTPLSYTITLNHTQHLDMNLQIFRLIGSIGSIIIGYSMMDYMLAVQLYSITYCLYYLGHSVIQFRAARGL